MNSIYLNSLNSLLYENNPVVLVIKQIMRSLTAIYNFRKNMARAQNKLETLERRLHFVEAQVTYNYVKPPSRSQFDVYR